MEQFIDWDGRSDSVDFLFDFLELLNPALNKQLLQDNDAFKTLADSQKTNSLDWKLGKTHLEDESRQVISDLLSLVNDWYAMSHEFFGAMTHPELIKERISSWSPSDTEGLEKFKKYVDFWWESENRNYFLKSFEESLFSRFGEEGTQLYNCMRELFDGWDLPDNIYNFIAYRKMIDHLVETTFMDVETEEPILPQSLIDNVLKPYVRENRILIPLIQAQSRFDA